MNTPTLSRRGFLGGGALVVGFTLFPCGLFAQAPQEGDGGTPPGMPKDLNKNPLLERTPSPSDAEIREALKPNLCRCGTHMRIMKAVRRAAGFMQTADAGGITSNGEDRR